MMDYHAIHGHDIASFDTSSTTHRLPTVSASQALDELRDNPSSHVSTGLDDLDRALLDSTFVDTSRATPHGGGVKRGQVTEIWGPPGAGKTALGIQIAESALADGKTVVWVDCFQALRSERLAKVVEAGRERRGDRTPEEGDRNVASRFLHYSCQTLPHFIALISRPTPKSIPVDTRAIVVSSLSALINAALPKSNDRTGETKASKGPSKSARRLEALQSIISALQRLAATKNCAVVILSQCTTKMRSESGATLVAAVNATVWEQGVAARLVLFRDWVWRDRKLASIFLAGLQKVNGKATYDAVEHVVAFTIGQAGLSKASYDPTQSAVELSHLPRSKRRKLGQTELDEIPDSEDDEDYGWAEEDEAAMPAPPPQWQGSEDILLGQEVGRSDEEDGSEAEAEEEEEEDRGSDEVATFRARG